METYYHLHTQKKISQKFIILGFHKYGPNDVRLNGPTPTQNLNFSMMGLALENNSLHKYYIIIIKIRLKKR